MPGPPRDSLFDVIAGSEVTRDTESSREAILVYQNMGFQEEESDLPDQEFQNSTTSEARTSTSSGESDQSTPILQRTGKVDIEPNEPTRSSEPSAKNFPRYENLESIEEESELPGSESEVVTTSGSPSASSRESDQSTPILQSSGRVDQERNQPTKSSAPSKRNLPRYENLESIEEESELPGFQFQDVTTSGSASASSRESDQSTPILGNTGQDIESNEPTRPSERLAEHLPRYENRENLESFRVVKHLVPIYQYVDCRPEEPVRFRRPQPEEIPIETPCLDFTVNFVLDYWKLILLGLFILGVIIFLIVFFATSKHTSSAAPTTTSFATVTTTEATVTTTVTESKESAISTTSPTTNVPANLTSPPVDDCTPKTDTTFLFAYSNDLSPGVVEKGRDLILQYIQTTKIVSFANNRFDTTADDSIYYHSSKQEFQQSVTDNLPDPKLSFPSENTGSDVLNVLRKFLINQDSPLCGAIVYILMKRWPNTEDVSDLIQQLRQRHIFVYSVSDTSQSGGNNQSLICEVTHGTNGFCDFQITGYMQDDICQSLKCISNTFQIVSQSYEVTGKRVIHVPSFVRPYQNDGLEPMALVITYQNHKRDANLKTVKYTIFDDKNENVWSYKLHSWDGNVFLNHPVLQNNVTYRIVINYEYGTVRTEKIEVRVYSSSAVDSWLPFSSYVSPS